MTGYVHNMVEKKQSFADFAMSCARAFGALVTMREESMDAPIPTAFVPSDYHVKERDKAIVKLAKLKTMTNKERIAFGEAEKKKSVADYRNAMNRAKKENEPLLAMLDKVSQWKPPSTEHVHLKEFMEEQLRTSLSQDNADSFFAKELLRAETKAAVDFYSEAVSEAERSVAYHKKELAAEEKRCADRTEWVNQLRESLTA